MFERFLAQIADAYAALPEGGPACLHIEQCWRDLAHDSVDRAAGIRLLLAVGETDDPEPYAGTFAAAEMCDDIARGHFIVSRANSEHPVWSVEQNVAFRIVHDVLGHYAATVGTLQRRDPAAPPILGEWETDESRVAGFDWEGENRACAAHMPLLPTEGARVALFTECIAQTGYAIDRGEFGPQKIGDVGAQLQDRVFQGSAAAADLLSLYRRWRAGEVV